MGTSLLQAYYLGGLVPTPRPSGASATSISLCMDMRVFGFSQEGMNKLETYNVFTISECGNERPGRP